MRGGMPFDWLAGWRVGGGATIWGIPGMIDVDRHDESRGGLDRSLSPARRPLGRAR